MKHYEEACIVTCLYYSFSVDENRPAGLLSINISHFLNFYSLGIFQMSLTFLTFA